MLILIIEDDIIWQTKIEAILYEIDISWTVRCAHDISKAIKFIEDNVPDIILADVLIGSETIFRFLENEIYKKIPIIFMTVSEDDLFYKTSRDFPDSHYLIKPFHKLSLLSAIEKTMINSKRQLARNLKGVSVRGIHNEKINLKVHDIVCVESKKNYCILKTLNNQFALKISLIKLLEDFTPDLFQIHKTFLINKKFVSKISLSKSEISTEIGNFPIGRKFKNNVLDFMEEIRTNKFIS